MADACEQMILMFVIVKDLLYTEIGAKNLWRSLQLSAIIWEKDTIEIDIVFLFCNE